MQELDYVTVQVTRHMGKWAYQVFYRLVDDRPTPRWHSTPYVVLDVAWDTISEVLDALAEDLYNLAPLTTKPTASRLPAPLGGASNSVAPASDA